MRWKQIEREALVPMAGSAILAAFSASARQNWKCRLPRPVGWCGWQLVAVAMCGVAELAEMENPFWLKMESLPLPSGPVVLTSSLASSQQTCLQKPFWRRPCNLPASVKQNRPCCFHDWKSSSLERRKG